MKKLLSTLAIGAGLISASAVASPAQDVFDQASFLIEFNYNGFSSVNLQDLIKKYQTELDNACADKKDSCDYDVARGLIDKMTSEIGDHHTNYWDIQANTDRKRADVGAPSPRPRIGITNQFIDGSGYRLVIEVVEGSPAEKAGLQRGDRIIAVDGAALPLNKDENTKFFSTKLGSGQPVRLTILRGSEKKLEITVQAIIFPAARVPSLQKSDFLPKEVAILRIPNFDLRGKIGGLVHELVIKASQDGIKSLIIDLRDNSGGPSNECLISAGAFDKSVTVLRSEKLDLTKETFRNGSLYNKTNSFPEFLEQKIDKTALWDGKVAVLVNKNTASCGEGLAYLLQVAKIGPVIGEQTAGVLNTGTIIFDLIDGSGMQVTTVKVLRADGIPRPEFVSPDVEISDDLIELGNTGRDVVLEKALEVLGYKK